MIALFALLRPLGGLLRVLAPFLVAGFLGALAADHAPWVGFQARLSKVSDDRDRWRSSAEDYLRSAGAWQKSYWESEGLRIREGAVALQAQSESAKICDARVSSARQSAIAIERIVTKESAYDPSRCPVRSVVPADLLRDALAPGS